MRGLNHEPTMLKSRRHPRLNPVGGGAAWAVADVVNGGSMVGLVGRNGAGKTTMLRTMMGHLKRQPGPISFDGQDLARVHRHERAVLGIGYMPEDRGLVPELTVEENILVPVWVSKSLKVDQRLAFGLQGAARTAGNEGPPCACCCLAASKSWWHWRVRWPWAPACCCWTSPLKAWPRR
jgi:ABC-type sugar transport system ATPase subunit